MKTPWFTLAVTSLIAGAQAATVTFVQNSKNDANGTTIAAVSASASKETGVSYSTLAAPESYSTYRFTHWTNTSYPAASYRDAWGRSLNPTSLLLLENTTATAHYLPAILNTDADGVLDWFEMEYYGNLTKSSASDTDGDGLTLLQEYQAGKHPLYANATQEGGVAATDSAMVSVNLAGYSHYTLRSIPAGTVDQSNSAVSGAVITTPDLSANASFGYWTLDGARQQDAWGRSLPVLTFTMAAADREAIAYLFPGDTDVDGVPDAYEQAYYGSLANNGSSDTDGDGITLLGEYTGGKNPRYANAAQAGGVAWADSSAVTVNLAGFHRYTLGSLPEGTVDQSAVVANGTVITSPAMLQPAFGGWTLDGVRQQDPWGVALREITFMVDGADRAAVAGLFAGDSDADGIGDGFEQFHYGTLANGAASDTDGDGIPLLAEFTNQSNPLYGNARQDGGVAWGDSAMALINLQPFERVAKIQVTGVLSDFFSPDPATVTGIQAGTWSATAVTDWDGDGDFDLFVAHEDGLRVFRNIGTAHNPNFEEVSGGFSALATFVASIDRPSLAGGDWNGDGRGDLVIGGATATLRLIASAGTFSSNASGADLAVGSASARPALGDMDGDGKADLIVLLDDGSARAYFNNGLAMPYAGAGNADFLGVAAPEGTGITTGDINQDGLADVLLADEDGRLWEFLKTAGGGFSLRSKVWGGSHEGFAAGLTPSAVDLEGDGDLDLIGGLANGGVIALRDPSVGRPTGLTATPGADSIQLDWDANWQSRIRGYYVYRSATAAGPWAKVAPDYVPLPSYLDTPVDPAVLNHYYVSGVSHFFLPGNSEPTIVESLSSDVAVAAAGKVILSVRPTRGSPDKQVKIKLAIENSMGVSGNGMQLTVAYDPARLRPAAQADPDDATVLATGLSRNLTFTDNGASASGNLVITGSGGVLEPGSGKFFTLQFEVAAGLPNETVLGVAITGATMRDLNGNALVVQIVPLDAPESGGNFTEGDLDGDGAITNADKNLLKELIKPKSRAASADELMAGDLNGDGKLDEKDLVLVMQLLQDI